MKKKFSVAIFLVSVFTFGSQGAPIFPSNDGATEVGLVKRSGLGSRIGCIGGGFGCFSGGGSSEESDRRPGAFVTPDLSYYDESSNEQESDRRPGTFVTPDLSYYHGESSNEQDSTANLQTEVDPPRTSQRWESVDELSSEDPAQDMHNLQLEPHGPTRDSAQTQQDRLIRRLQADGILGNQRSTRPARRRSPQSRQGQSSRAPQRERNRAYVDVDLNSVRPSRPPRAPRNS